LRNAGQSDRLGPGGMTTGRGALGRFSAVLLVTVVIAASGCDRTEVSPGDRDRPATSDLERALSALGTRTGSVALVRTDGGIERGASGEAEPGRPAEPHDRFAIESTTKTFVATVVLQLVGERRLSLQDTVGDLLPGVLRAVRPITVRQLLNHSSGLLGDSIGPGQPVFPPGTRFYYSNANYVLLGQIVEEVTGRPLERVVLDRIFHPLDLDDTSYGTTAIGSPDEGPWLGYPVVPGPVTGNTGIVSTVDDVAIFFAALLGGKLLRPDLLADMTHTIEAGEGVRVGLGIFRRELSCGLAWANAGDGDVYSTASLVARDGSKVVVVAQNSSGWEAAISVAEDIYCS
jgi:D-alanyl-D-alanine carboxypeptidase